MIIVNFGSVKKATIVSERCVLSGSPTWCTVFELQVIEGGSSAQVNRADPLEYQVKVPQLPQRDLRSVPFIPLMPRLAPRLPQTALRLWRRAASTKGRSCGGQWVTSHQLQSFHRADGGVDYREHRRQTKRLCQE